MTLENKLGITDSAKLARMEEQISKKKAAIYLSSADWISWKLAVL